MEGRETGSAGQKKGQYLIDQYKKEGISFPKERQVFTKRYHLF
jgi:hypothetical protein